MQKYVLLLSYQGTKFCGWQKQKGSAAAGAPSIQETIEAAVERITGERISLVGSGRTDSGVHAVGQVAHFVLSQKLWKPEVLKNGLNSLLTTDIRVLGAGMVALDFHAQRSAEKKQYSYYFQQGPCALPHLEPYSWWIRKTLDLEAMNEGLRIMIGEHDFKPFQASGAKPGPTTRRILEAEVSRVPVAFPGGMASQASMIRVRVIGTGFLKQMVRGIAGTLLQVGESRRPASCFAEILATRDRALVGPTAPARALWLEQVWYAASLDNSLQVRLEP